MNTHIKPTQESGMKFFQKFNNKGKVVMLNLLKFNPIADYTNLDAIKPNEQITGEAAYQIYSKHTIPLLEKSGGKVLFYGKSSHFLIGPESESWDAVLLVEHQSVQSFMGFAQDDEYLKTAGHRTAALEDSRLLPISEQQGKVDV